MDNLDSERKLKVYEMILSRYKTIINEKENRSVSEIRQLISPYDDYIKSLRDRIIEELQPYVYEKHFFSAVQKCVNYIKSIYNLRLPVVFWMTFQELDELKAGPLTDQCVLLCSLLRALGSNDAKVYFTQSKKYVGFRINNESYLIDPESGSLFRGSDAENAFKEDKLKYAFSDLYFESFEE